MCKNINAHFILHLPEISNLFVFNRSSFSENITVFEDVIGLLHLASSAFATGHVFVCNHLFVLSLPVQRGSKHVWARQQQQLRACEPRPLRHGWTIIRSSDVLCVSCVVMLLNGLYYVAPTLKLWWHKLIHSGWVRDRALQGVRIPNSMKKTLKLIIKFHLARITCYTEYCFELFYNVVMYG